MAASEQRVKGSTLTNTGTVAKLTLTGQTVEMVTLFMCLVNENISLTHLMACSWVTVPTKPQEFLATELTALRIKISVIVPSACAHPGIGMVVVTCVFVPNFNRI